MDELTEEFYALRLSVSPALALIDELKAIRRSRRISEESSITLLNLLKLDIKEEILTTMRSFQIEEEKKVADLQEQIRDNQKEARDKFYDQGQSLTNLEMDLQNLGDLIARQGSFMENQNKNFDNMKKDIGDKASSKDLLDTKKILKHYTPLSDFNVLSNQVADCSTKSSLDIIRKELHSLEKRVKAYITADELNEGITKAQENLHKNICEHFLKLKEFNQEKVFTEKRFERNEDDVKVLFQKNELVSDQMKKKFREVIEMVKKKPWDPDILNLQSQIYECSTKTEFASLNAYISPKIMGFQNDVTEAIGNVRQFEKILSRYDEILLDKASKDDVGQINSKIPSFASVNSFKELAFNLTRLSETTEETLHSLTAKSTEIKSAFQNLSQKFELIRRENLEVSTVAHSISNLSEKLSEKADKSDIYLIYDVMGRKEEIQNIHESDVLFKKQLDASVVILHSLCRTMLKSGESPAVTRKQRYDLYRNLTNLIGWINGEDLREPHITPTTKSPINLRTDFDLEGYNDLLTSARLTKRTRRNVMTTSPRNKTMIDFVNLPPIV